jgi:2-keto-4-pentenoate hydratase/2-oxohepta-3-ene-1,7-dioic acid hydratase in catechol pathway
MVEQSPVNIDPATGLLKGSFAIGSFAQGARRFPGLVRPDGSVRDVGNLFHDTHAIFDSWDRNFDQLSTLAAGEWAAPFQFRDLRALPPVSHPNLLCAGANYKQHVAEMLTRNKFNQHNRKPGESDEDFFKRNYAITEQRQREGTPFFWTGLHSSLTGANDDVVLPLLGSQHDWELELGVIVARTARYASVREAESLIAGYLVVNDLGSVDQFRRSDVPWGFDWVSKHQPTFKPAGPFIVPAPFVRISDDVRIRLKVNGNVMQDWPVTDMIFSIPQILAYASERIKLLPGDLLITGSPPGNGAHHGRFLQAGDVIESEITYLGRQRNRCVAEDVGDRKPAFGYWKSA